MASLSEQYRQYAAECLRIAQETHDQALKVRLLEMAEAWKALAVLELHRAKKIHLIAVSSRTRLQAQPDVPTAVDEGFGNVIWGGFHGVFAPANTSADIVKRLAEASEASMAANT